MAHRAKVGKRQGSDGNKKMAAVLTRLLEENRSHLQRIQQMGFVLTYLVTTAEHPIAIPMDFTPAENFDGLNMIPDADQQVLHITPVYRPEPDTAEDDYPEPTEFELEAVAAQAEGMSDGPPQ